MSGKYVYARATRILIGITYTVNHRHFCGATTATRYRLFPPFISISPLQMSKQKRHRKELARKKRDTNARRRHHHRRHSFVTLLPRFSRTSSWRMSSNLFFRSYRSQRALCSFVCRRDLVSLSLLSLSLSHSLLLSVFPILFSSLFFTYTAVCVCV